MTYRSVFCFLSRLSKSTWCEAVRVDPHSAGYSVVFSSWVFMTSFWRGHHLPLKSQPTPRTNPSGTGSFNTSKIRQIKYFYQNTACFQLNVHRINVYLLLCVSFLKKHWGIFPQEGGSSSSANTFSSHSLNLSKKAFVCHWISVIL